MNDHKKACELGEQALSEALEKIDDVDEETFRDAKSIIELLKENLSLWKEEEGDNAVEDLWAIELWKEMKYFSLWVLRWKYEISIQSRKFFNNSNIKLPFYFLKLHFYVLLFSKQFLQPFSNFEFTKFFQFLKFVLQLSFIV